MAEFGSQLSYTMKAAGDLSAAQYHIMRDKADGTVDITSKVNILTAVGVLQNKPAAANRAATIAYAGKSKIRAGGSITMGDLLTTNSSGRAATAGSGDLVIGRALATAGADGDTITCILYPPYLLLGVA